MTYFYMKVYFGWGFYSYYYYCCDNSNGFINIRVLVSQTNKKLLNNFIYFLQFFMRNMYLRILFNFKRVFFLGVCECLCVSVEKNTLDDIQNVFEWIYSFILPVEAKRKLERRLLDYVDMHIRDIICQREKCKIWK